MKENSFYGRNPRVAVLMAAYNGMQWIDCQIDSILNQSNVNVTLFISVDRSTDGTLAHCKALAHARSDVFVLAGNERFGSAGPNFYKLIREVDFTNFDAVALADQDDIWINNKLSRACNLMKELDCQAVSSDVTAFWPCGRTKLIKKSYPQRQFDHFFEPAGPGCTYVLGQSSIVAMQAFLRRLGSASNGITFHDWLTYAFCRHNGFKWHIDDKPMTLYRQHNNNQFGANAGLKAILKRLQLVKRKWYRQQVLSIINAVAPEMERNLTSFGFMFWHFRKIRRKPLDQLAFLGILLIGFY